jgi:hypothetical protein
MLHSSEAGIDSVEKASGPSEEARLCRKLAGEDYPPLPTAFSAVQDEGLLPGK